MRSVLKTKVALSSSSALWAKIIRHFGSVGQEMRRRHLQRRRKNASEEKNTKMFSNLLDRKVSIFSKKNAKSPEAPQAAPPAGLGSLDESGWTIL
jgi:hypothetical protein